MLKEKMHLPEEYFFRQFHYGNAGITLNSRICMTGYELARQGNYCWDGLKRGNAEFILWQYSLGGAGELRFEDETFVLTPGRAMLLKIPHHHCYQVYKQSKDWEIAFIIMRGSECLRIGEEMIKNYGPVADFYSSPKVLELAEKIIRSHNENDACGMSVLAYSFIMCMGAEIVVNGNPAAMPEALKSAKRYALKNFSHDLSVADLAQAAGMSYSHFTREFILHFGVSPGAYLLQLQLEKAVNLLQSSSLSIKEIAIECGFASSSYFCRSFSHKFNTPPGAFRKKT